MNKFDTIAELHNTAAEAIEALVELCDCKEEMDEDGEVSVGAAAEGALDLLMKTTWIERHPGWSITN